MRVRFILPALAEAERGLFRPIKYALFPPLGLATLAGYLEPDDEIELYDQHVEPVPEDGEPDLVAIEVYITSAHRAYAMADRFRARGIFVVMGGLHPTSLPEEALREAWEEASAADVMLVLGSSLTVFPAAALPDLTLKNGGKLIVVNDQPTRADAAAALRFSDLGEVFDRFEREKPFD